MNKKCQIYTPDNYVDILLDSIGYKNSIYGKKILENSCGDGNILSKIVLRYINDCKINKYNEKKISAGLENDIYGIEIDKKTYSNCLDRLNKIIKKEGLPPVNWKVYNINYFNWKADTSFSYIVGNPPYITYSEINKKERIFLRKNFISCKKGKFDYCYAFIEKSLLELNNTGKLSYLIPSSIFKTVFGQNLREIILPYVTNILDYSTKNIFSNALVKSSIINIDKSTSSNSLLYFIDDKKKLIKKETLTSKWIFSNSNNVGIHRFGDFFQVSHSIATLCNKAFLLNNCIEKDDYYEIADYRIEKDIVRPAVSAKTFRYSINMHILFPYYYKDGKLFKYSVDYFKCHYPEAHKYLQSFKEELNKRKSDTSAKWFEYGRSQALSTINQPKLLISTVISDKVLLYKTDTISVPYAGMFIIPKSNYSLDKAKEILESKEFLEYALSIGVHMSGNSVRIMSKDIMEYKF